MVLICGLPNAGKTTYSANYDNVIHYDEVHAQKGQHPQKLLCEMVSKASQDVCVEGIFITARERRAVVQASNAEHKTCIWLNTPIDECMKRENRNRATCLIQSCAELFEPPTKSEGWDEIIVIR